MSTTYIVLKIMLYYGHFILLYGFYGKSQGETMNVLACTTREMWIDLLWPHKPHPTAGGRAGAYCLYLSGYRGIGSPVIWAGLVFWFMFSNGFPTVVGRSLNASLTFFLHIIQ